MKTIDIDESSDAAKQALKSTAMVAIEICTDHPDMKGNGEYLSDTVADCVLAVLQATPEKWIEYLEQFKE